MQTLTVADEKDDKLLRTTATLDLSLKRYGSLVRLRREEGTVETREGKVVALSLKQGAAGGKQLVIQGMLVDNDMHIKIDAGRLERKLKWHDDVHGLARQQEMFVARKPKPGDKFEMLRYEPTYNVVLRVGVHVKAREVVDVLGVRRSLLRVELTPDRLAAPGKAIEPPKTILWLEDNFVVVRRQIELEGLGSVILTRTTKELANATTTPASVDIGSRSLITLDRVIRNPYESRSVVYHVHVRDEAHPESVLSQDMHQEVRNASGQTFELHVHPAQPGKKGDDRSNEEHLGSSHFLDHADARVKELAKRAVGGETEAWKKALKIERYVKNVMVNDNAAALVPASQVAQTLRGDCRHHAFLCVALCRAEGIPARTAIGLLYVVRGGPKLGFHMWTEVWIDGQWLGLDSTLGKQGVSAAHVKITEHTWHDTASLTPLLPVNRVLGKLRVKVLRAE
jgi:hypothetical protein